MAPPRKRKPLTHEQRAAKVAYDAARSAKWTAADRAQRAAAQQVRRAAEAALVPLEHQAPTSHRKLSLTPEQRGQRLAAQLARRAANPVSRTERQAAMARIHYQAALKFEQAVRRVVVAAHKAGTLEHGSPYYFMTTLEEVEAVPLIVRDVHGSLLPVPAGQAA